MKISSSAYQGGRTSQSAELLKRCDGRRVAVIMPELGPKPLRGAARYERDDVLGNVLRIKIEGNLPGNPHMLLVEDEWNGLIIPDTQYGCDYCVTQLPTVD